MNASASPDASPHSACLSIGSNIDPEHNIPRAVALLRQVTRVEALSTCWETRAVGSNGPNFINLAVLLHTQLDAADLKTRVINEIESTLGRVRTADKNAPRTIDLDIILFDGIVLDANLWRKQHVALPVAEFYPELLHPESGLTLQQIAEQLQQVDPPLARPDVKNAMVQRRV